MGRCHALELARRGARVVVNDLGGHPFGGGEDAGLAEAVVRGDPGRGRRGRRQHGVGRRRRRRRQPDGAGVETWGRLDAVVANAAIVRDRPFDEMTMADFDDLIDVNLRGTMRVVQPAYKAMRAGGGGRIVTVTSSSGMLGAHFQANYAASKAAMSASPGPSPSRARPTASRPTPSRPGPSARGCTWRWSRRAG